MTTKLSNPLLWFTVRDVASHLGLSEERVRQLVRTKQIKATKIGGWLIRPEDLNEFIHSRTNLYQHEPDRGLR